MGKREERVGVEVRRTTAEEIQNLQANLDEANAERDSLVAENEEMLVQLGLFHQKIQESDRENLILQERLELVESSGDARLADDQRIAELDSRNAELQSQATSMSSQVAQLENEVKSKKKELSQLQGSLADAEGSNEDIRKALERSQASLDHARAAGVEKDAEISHLKDRLNELEQRYIRLE